MQEVRIRSVLTCETETGVCAQVLRARSRPRHAGQHRRGGRRHRRAVDRRAGHAAHHAHVPHRRRGADGRPVVHRVELQRHGADQEPQRREGQPGPPDRHGPQHRRSSIVDQGGKELATHKVPTAPACTSTKATRSSAAPVSRSGIPTPVRSSPRSTASSDFEDLVEGVSVSEQTDEMKGTTNRVIIDWRATPRGADLKPAVVDQGRQGQADQAAARRRCPLPAAGRRHSVGRAGCAGEGRRRAGAYPDRVGQVGRHHRRSAARRRAVRGAPSEGSRDHRGDLGHGRVRQGLQEQAAHHDQAGRRERRSRSST